MYGVELDPVLLIFGIQDEGIRVHIHSDYLLRAVQVLSRYPLLVVLIPSDRIDKDSSRHRLNPPPLPRFNSQCRNDLNESEHNSDISSRETWMYREKRARVYVLTWWTHRPERIPHRHVYPTSCPQKGPKICRPLLPAGQDIEIEGSWRIC